MTREDDEGPEGEPLVPRIPEAEARLEALEDPHAEFAELGRAPVWLRPLLSYQRTVDRVSERIGRSTRYLVVAVVVIGFVNALARYVGRFTGRQITSNLWFEVQWYLFGTIFLLAFAYILKNDINVRVDFWFANRSERTKAAIDLVGHLFALVPFCLLALLVLWGPTLTSWGARPDGSFATWRVWEIWERSPDPQGLPRAPIKTMLVVGFGLLLAQTLAELVKLLATLTGHGHRTTPATPKRVE